MTEDDIIDLADKAGSFSMIQYGVTSAKIEWLQKFADLVAAKEREACAQMCDDWPNGRDDVCLLADAIRARGDK